MSVFKFALRAVGTVLMFWVAFAPVGYSQAPAPAPVPAPSDPPGVAQPPARPGRPPRRFVMDDVATKRLADLRAPLDKLTPVTDAMLRNPSPNDWLNWRRTDNGWGHSPLNQINRENVKNLQVAWTWGMNSSGMNSFTPLVHDGIMFLWNYGETIQALDARNGNLLWQYQHILPEGFEREVFYKTKKALAIGGNKLIFPTTDMHILALDVKTGQLIWDVVPDDHKNTRVYNGGPLVIHDKVIMGASGCAPGGAIRTAACFITGHDLETGKELWRFSTIAMPGEPGGDTWNNVPADRRWGASIWNPPSYDAELNLVIVGTGSPYPWSSVERGTYNPVGGGNKGDGLYFNSTLALNPDTGKLVWYYQHLPNDTFDQDYAFERLIVNVDYRGRKRKAVITAGKPAVIEVIDAATGRFLYARDPGAQNIFTFNEETGVKKLLAPGPPDGIKRCPSNNGARNYLAGLVQPEHQSLLHLGQRHLHAESRRDDRPPDRDGRQHRGFRDRHPVPGDAVVSQADHRGGPAVLGLGRSLRPRLRRPRWHGAVADPRPGRAERIPDHLHGGRQAVHRDGRRQPRSGRQRRRTGVGGVHAAVADVGVVGLAAPGRQLIRR